MPVRNRRKRLLRILINLIKAIKSQYKMVARHPIRVRARMILQRSPMRSGINKHLGGGKGPKVTPRRSPRNTRSSSSKLRKVWHSAETISRSVRMRSDASYRGL
jgi:hypothetical protein